MVVVGVVLVVVVVGPLVVVVCVVVGLVLRVLPMESLWVFRSPLWGWGVGKIVSIFQTRIVVVVEVKGS